MKILTFFHLLFFLLLVSGCNNSDMPVDPIPQLVEISEKDTDMELNAFFLAVDSLNDNYLPYTTRTNIRKWGSRFLSAVVDASVGAVASAATTPIGGTIIGTGASWAYEEYLGNILDKVESSSSTGTDNQAFVPVVILAPERGNMTFVDSVGYYHNMLLAEIAKSGKTYLDQNGEVDIEELFTDITAMLDEKKQVHSGASAQNELAAFSSPVSIFINTLNPNDERTLDKSFASFESEGEALGISVKELSSIKEICSKISNVILYLENEKTIEYGEKLYKVIDDSNISETQKQSFKILDNIIVNSKLYWTTVQ